MNFRVQWTPKCRPAAPCPAPPVRKPALPEGRVPTAAGRGGAAARRSLSQPHRPPQPRSPSPRPATTFPSRPRGARAPQLTHFPARPGLGRPPRPGGCSLLTGVWAGSGGGSRRRCWPPPLPPLLGAWAAPRVSAAAMDEQAGPGVFFSNNHPGAGGAKGLGPLAEAAAAGDGAAAAGAARAQYSLPGILHFLQHEWARFEVERAQWEVERAELQVKTLPAWPFLSRLFALFRPAPDPFPSPLCPRWSTPLCSCPSYPELSPSPFTFAVG